MCFSLLFLCSVVWEKNKQEKNSRLCPKVYSRVPTFFFFEEGRRKNIFLNLSWIHKSLLRAYYKHTHTERERET